VNNYLDDVKPKLSAGRHSISIVNSPVFGGEYLTTGTYCIEAMGGSVQTSTAEFDVSCSTIETSFALSKLVCLIKKYTANKLPDRETITIKLTGNHVANNGHAVIPCDNMKIVGIGPTTVYGCFTMQFKKNVTIENVVVNGNVRYASQHGKSAHVLLPGETADDTAIPMTEFDTNTGPYQGMTTMTVPNQTFNVVHCTNVKLLSCSGIQSRGGLIVVGGNLKASNCSFDNNARCGVFCASSHLELKNCRIYNNANHLYTPHQLLDHFIRSTVPARHLPPRTIGANNAKEWDPQVLQYILSKKGRDAGHTVNNLRCGLMAASSSVVDIEGDETDIYLNKRGIVVCRSEVNICNSNPQNSIRNNSRNAMRSASHPVASILNFISGDVFPKSEARKTKERAIRKLSKQIPKPADFNTDNWLLRT